MLWNSSVFAPLEVTPDSPCGEEESGDDTLPLRLQFTGPEGEVLALFDQQRGMLALDGGEHFEIAVIGATTNHCCHQLRDIVVLAQRVL